jgi:poly-gamma-glutamate synthesis protein (capsule biosynthesis protein)
MRRYKQGFLFLLIFFLFSCATRPPMIDREEGIGEIPIPVPSPVIEETPAEIETPPREDYLTIIAVGDNLYHDVMIRSGENGDYESAYSEIKALVEKADIAFINQETTLAGESFGFSGYPNFNSPQNLGRAIWATGFNVVNHATNHIMDKGENAVFATMDFWDTIPNVTVLGIHRSEKERDLPMLLRKNNITLGFLSYTYGTNGIPLPRDKPYLASLINTEVMAKEIDILRPLCDFLVVSMHWGEEYHHEYNKTQETLAAFLAEHRVDLVIGHHPHVIQPIEYITRPDGSAMLCVYSLGNLLSAQNQNATLLGALAYIRIKKLPAGDSEAVEIVFMDAGAIPLVTHYERGYTGFKAYPLYAYSEELLTRHWKNLDKKELTMNYLNETAAKILGDKEIRQNPFD